jgi:hypothetical protein
MRLDELRPLPANVMEPLLQALRAIPPRQDRLLLQRSDRPRPPTRAANEDYKVICRSRTVGRIWCHDYTGTVSGDMARHLWHWDWHDVPGRRNATGHAPTLEAAMADFRRAWDRLEIESNRAR